MIFFFLWFILLVRQGQGSFTNYTKTNATFAWPQDTFTNSVNVTLTETNVSPYQIVEDCGPGQVNIWYDYTGCETGQTATALWKNTEPFYIRVDSNDQLSFQISVDANPNSNLAKFVFRLYLQFEGVEVSTFVNFICISINRIYSGTGNYMIGGDSYRLDPGFPGATIKYLVINKVEPQFVKTIKLKEITDVLLQTNQIQLSFYLKEVSVVFSMFDAGSIVVNVQRKLPPRRGYLKPISRQFTKYKLSSTLFYPENRSSLDYSNMTTPANATSAESIVSDFRFEETPFRLNAYHYVVIGQLNGTQAISNKRFLFPIPVANALHVTIDFCFNESDDSILTQKAACVAIILSDSTINSTYPSTQIFICPWWSSALKQSGILLKFYEFNNRIYRLFKDKSFSLDGSESWLTYTFISQTKQLQTRNLNLMWFVRLATLFDQTISNKSISALQSGFRFYTGKGRFQLNEIQFSVQNPHQTNTILEVFYSFTRNLLPIPNLSILIKLFSLFRFVDTFSYYIYHKPRYDNGSMTFFKFTWQLTDARWNIPQLDPLFQKFNISYHYLLPPSSTQKTPDTYLVLDENAMFLQQTQDVWVRTIPLTLITFPILYIIHRLLKRFRITTLLPKILRKFTLLSFLWVSFFGQNLQYFSFRCFSQFYDLKATQQMLFGIIFSHLILFLVIFYDISSYFILPTFSPCKSLLLEGYRHTIRTITHLTFLNLFRVFNGIIHSLLYHYDVAQTGCLLAIETLTLYFILINRRIYERKTMLVCNLFEFLIRTFIHLILFCETLFQFLNSNISLPIRIWISQQTDTLFLILLSISVIDIFFDNLIYVKKIHKNSLKKTQNLTHPVVTSRRKRIIKMKAYPSEGKTVIPLQFKSEPPFIVSHKKINFTQNPMTLGQRILHQRIIIRVKRNRKPNILTLSEEPLEETIIKLPISSRNNKKLPLRYLSK